MFSQILKLHDIKINLLSKLIIYFNIHICEPEYYLSCMLVKCFRYRVKSGFNIFKMPKFKRDYIYRILAIKNEILPSVIWMDLEGILLSEISQTKKDK